MEIECLREALTNLAEDLEDLTPSEREEFVERALEALTKEFGE